MKNLKVIEEGLIPIYENDAKEQLVNARELHTFLGVGTKFADWIKGRIEKYEFAENVDFTSFPKKEKTETTWITTKEYILTLDTAKELAMVENNTKGHQVRRYFIEVEKRYKEITKKEMKQLAQREAGIIVRNMLTDTIKEKIPESPHKQFAYPNYTKLIYKVLFSKTISELRSERGISKKQNLRDNLNADELKEVQQLENIVTGLIALGMGYEEIKEMLLQRYLKQIA